MVGLFIVLSCVNGIHLNAFKCKKDLNKGSTKTREGLKRLQNSCFSSLQRNVVCKYPKIPQNVSYFIDSTFSVFHWNIHTHAHTHVQSSVHHQLFQCWVSRCWLLWFQGADTWLILSLKVSGCRKCWYKTQLRHWSHDGRPHMLDMLLLLSTLQSIFWGHNS